MTIEATVTAITAIDDLTNEFTITVENDDDIAFTCTMNTALIAFTVERYTDRPVDGYMQLLNAINNSNDVYSLIGVTYAG